jgi:pimeloyl-ACP methyl ester carboxylesterase
MRACEPVEDGYVERDGVKLFYEVFGQGEPTVLLLPTWSIIHSRHWKFQVPDLARRHRVVTFDGRGNGRSDRPVGSSAYHPTEFAADAIAVMDATGTDTAVLVAFSFGTRWALELGTSHPERVLGVVFIGPSVPLAPLAPERRAFSFTDRLETTEGWAKFNRHYWQEHYKDFVEFFFGRLFHEPHSTKQIEDCVGWALETDPETLVATREGGWDPSPGSVATEGGARSKVAGLSCPVLVVHGEEDGLNPIAIGAVLAELSGGTLAPLGGSGHGPHIREPVRFNLLLRDFVDRVTPSRPLPPQQMPRTRALRRPRRALYISSPIGLGHARRDVAIAAELRHLHPDVEIDWLAQDPVTRVLESEEERVHPASRALVSESAHVDQSRPGTTSIASRRSGRWTRSSSPTSWCSTT